jgi:hypothetical protein
MSGKSLHRRFAAVVALVAWSALLLQYLLLLRLIWDGIGPWLATLRYFSYFTILSNVLVALATTHAWLAPSSGCGRFLASPRVRGGIALCIAITGGIYFFVLAATWSPQDTQWLVDVSLHYAVPVLYLAWWAVCVPHGQLVWTDALRWLAFPLTYLAWTLLRGRWLHEYPYPFVDVTALGFAVVARNALGIAVLFLLLGLLLVAIDRYARRPR